MADKASGKKSTHQKKADKITQALDRDRAKKDYTGTKWKTLCDTCLRESAMVPSVYIIRGLTGSQLDLAFCKTHFGTMPEDLQRRGCLVTEYK
jgi:hypothetical protein